MGTPLPGTQSTRQLDRGRDLLLGVGLAGDYPLPFVAARRDGWFLENVDGNRYLDWVNGWATRPRPDGEGDRRGEPSRRQRRGAATRAAFAAPAAPIASRH